MNPRTLPLARLDEINVDMGDAQEVYGDSLDLFPAIEDHCPRSPHGEHVYAGPRGEICIYCDMPSELDV